MKKGDCFYVSKETFDSQRGREDSLVAIEYCKGMQKIKDDLFVEIELVRVCKHE